MSTALGNARNVSSCGKIPLKDYICERKQYDSSLFIRKTSENYF